MTNKIIRYICDMSLIVLPLTDETPLPDPDNPFSIREMTEEEYENN